jgi:hypothetical protein
MEFVLYPKPLKPYITWDPPDKPDKPYYPIYIDKPYIRGVRNK